MNKKKLEKELNKPSSETIHILATKLTEQQKLIDKMAEWIDDRCFYSDDYGNSCEIIQDTCNNPDKFCKNCIIQHFLNEIKEEKGGKI
jgi:hypothetical protein